MTPPDHQLLTYCRIRFGWLFWVLSKKKNYFHEQHLYTVLVDWVHSSSMPLGPKKMWIYCSSRIATGSLSADNLACASRLTTAYSHTMHQWGLKPDRKYSGVIIHMQRLFLLRSWEHMNRHYMLYVHVKNTSGSQCTQCWHLPNTSGKQSETGQTPVSSIYSIWDRPWENQKPVCKPPTRPQTNRIQSRSKMETSICLFLVLGRKFLSRANLFWWKPQSAKIFE